MSERTKGLISALSAFLLWGLVPLYYKPLTHVSPEEMLAHRVVWSVGLLSLVMHFLGLWRVLFTLSLRQYATLFVSAVLVSTNWFVFIWAVGQDRVLETSLGYFINPLVSILLGMLVLGERLGRWQYVALGFAILGVANQVFWLGALPWVALALAFSFALYGLIRKQLQLNAVLGLWVETLLMMPFAVWYLVWLSEQGAIVFSHSEAVIQLLIACSGLVTVVPLLLFTFSTKRLSLIAVGFTQYLTPSMTFLLAIFLFHEPFDTMQLITFVLIWTGLAIFSLDGVMRARGRTPSRD